MRIIYLQGTSRTLRQRDHTDVGYTPNVRGVLTLLDLSLLGQTNIGIRNLRGYLVMLSQTYVKTMNMLCGSLSTCFLFVSLSRGRD